MTKHKKTNSKPKPKSILRMFFSGCAMGSADVVPGVSGGTIALILGIYEELIESIKHVSGVSLKLFLKFKFKEAILSIPWKFLVPLALGILTVIITLAKTIEWLLLNHPVYLWSFFFGLVLASVYFVGKRVAKWNANLGISMVIGAVLAYIIVGLVPVETPSTLFAFFLSGVIAICAMILPGISGSFLLIVLGKYNQVLSAVTERNLVVLGVFMAGCVIGLALFSRLLSWFFKNHHDLMMAILTGVMLGSLRKIWPWKEVVQTYTDSHGAVLPLVENNVLPGSYGLPFMFALGLMLLGILIIVKTSNYVDPE